MPLDPNITKLADDGRIEDYQTDALDGILAVIDKAERVDVE